MPVKSKSVKDREQALPQALGQVLIKVSGNSTIVTIPRIHGQLINASQILHSYRYQSNDNSAYPYLLIASFDRAAVNQMLTSNHQAIWGADRPLMLFWVVKVTDGNARFLSNSDDAQLYDHLKWIAKARGLPVVYPLMDLTDLNAISSSDIINDQESMIINASQRYPHSGIVTVILSNTPNAQWQGQWTLELNGKRTQFSEQGDDAAQVMLQGMNQLADNLANNYSVLHLGSGNERDFQLTVYGVNSVDEYVKIDQYLKHINSVRQVTIEQVLPDRVIFNLKVSGDKQLLQQAISIDNLLEPYDDFTVAEDNSAVLSYRVHS